MLRKSLPALKLASPLFFFMFLALPSLAQTSTEAQPENKPEDLSKWPGLLVALGGGSGWSLRPAPGTPAFAGVKFGACCVTLDLGYDRIPGHNGFAAEISGMLPVFRFPGPQKDENRNYFRLYAEPGLGFHAGGFVGLYPSAKAMLVLFSDRRLTSSATRFSPFIEVQRRVFLQHGQRGDLRIAAGIIWAICEHCGLE